MEKDILESFHRVVSYELDSFGHVNNAVFLQLLEKARNDFMLQKGLSFADFSRWGCFPVVTKATLIYKAPAYADDPLVIRGWITDWSQASFTLRYEIIHQEKKQLLLSGETSHVFVNANNKPMRLPARFFEKFIPAGGKTRDTAGDNR